jgi:phage recombination protein Bet
MSQAPATTKKEETAITYKAFGSDVEVKLSISIVRQFFTKPTKNGHQATDADCMRFMLLCRAGALNPAERDAYLVGYDGREGPEFSMTVAHSAFLKRAEANEQNNGMESGVIVLAKGGELIERQGDFYLDSEKVVGGWAKVFRKDVDRPYISRLRLDSRKKDNKFWNGDPAGMIAKCAEADALRQAFPTKLGALYIDGELREPTEREVTPRNVARATPLNPFAEPPALPIPQESAIEAEQIEQAEPVAE